MNAASALASSIDGETAVPNRFSISVARVAVLKLCGLAAGEGMTVILVASQLPCRELQQIMNRRRYINPQHDHRRRSG